MFKKFKSYFQESYQEFRRVNWPDRRETFHLTMIVIVVSLVVAALLGVLDIIFAYLLKRFLI